MAGPSFGRFADPSYGTQGGSASPMAGAQPAVQVVMPPSNTNVGPQQAGPAVDPSSQWKATTQHIPAGPHVPNVMVQTGGGVGPLNPGTMSAPYGAPPGYAGPPQMDMSAYAGAPKVVVYSWAAKDGWQYAFYQDGAITFRSPDGSHNHDVVRRPGDASYKAIVDQWVAEHPTAKGTPIYANMTALANQASPGVISTAVSAVADMASTLVGGSTAIAATPTDPALPAPQPNASPKWLWWLGGALVVGGAAAGAYWWYSTSQKKNPAPSQE